RHLFPVRGTVHRSSTRHAARPAQRQSADRRRYSLDARDADGVPQRRALLLQARAGYRVLPWLRLVDDRGGSVQLQPPDPHRGRFLPEGQLPVPDVTALERQLLQERLAKQRQYVLSNTRARWGFVGFGIALLVAVRLAGITSIAWPFIMLFAAGFAAANAAVRRLVERRAFQPWYAQLNLIVGCLLISAVLFAMGPNGHVLYGAYVIAPLQAALYL